MATVLGSIITDCADANARARQELRFATLFRVKPSFLGVHSYSPIEAAGNVLDQLDVLSNFPQLDKEQAAIVLVNVAPRGEDIRQRWDNGTPFCYFWTGRTLVVSTYEGHCLALARKHEIVHKVQLLDLPTVTAAAISWGAITPAEAKRINHTQFRSLEFLPLVAYWLWQKKPVPSQPQALDELPSVSNKVWYIDNFDNVKTTLLPADVSFAEGKQVTLFNNQVATCYTRLADVPKDCTALVIGSSGYGQHRFLEVVVGHRGKAASMHGYTIGQTVLKQD